MDYLREAIHLRAYGQVDPLVAYQKEAYQYFQSLLRRIREEVLYYLFRVESVVERHVRQRSYQLGTGQMPSVAEAQAAEAPSNGQQEAAGDGPRQPSQPVRVQKVGRNDPCPCGSGKKYKKCCMLKEQSKA
jgi:preprotein translocase subunit SecA